MKIELPDEEYTQLGQKITEWQQIHYENPYWFTEDSDNVYCHKCAKKKLRENQGWQLDGGFDYEEDGQIFCESCGRPLECTLTDYGAKEELKYFEESGFDADSDLDKYTAVNISGGIPLSHQKRLYNLIFGDKS